MKYLKLFENDYINYNNQSIMDSIEILISFMEDIEEIYKINVSFSANIGSNRYSDVSSLYKKIKEISNKSEQIETIQYNMNFIINDSEDIDIENTIISLKERLGKSSDTCEIVQLDITKNSVYREVKTKKMAFLKKGEDYKNSRLIFRNNTYSVKICIIDKKDRYNELS